MKDLGKVFELSLYLGSTLKVGNRNKKLSLLSLVHDLQTYMNERLIGSSTWTPHVNAFPLTCTL